LSSQGAPGQKRKNLVRVDVTPTSGTQTFRLCKEMSRMSETKIE